MWTNPLRVKENWLDGQAWWYMTVTLALPVLGLFLEGLLVEGENKAREQNVPDGRCHRQADPVCNDVPGPLFHGTKGVSDIDTCL